MDRPQRINGRDLAWSGFKSLNIDQHAIIKWTGDILGISPDLSCRKEPTQILGDHPRNFALERLRPSMLIDQRHFVGAGSYDELRTVHDLGERDRADGTRMLAMNTISARCHDPE